MYGSFDGFKVNNQARHSFCRISTKIGWVNTIFAIPDSFRDNISKLYRANVGVTSVDLARHLVASESFEN